MGRPLLSTRLKEAQAAQFATLELSESSNPQPSADSYRQTIESSQNSFNTASTDIESALRRLESLRNTLHTLGSRNRNRQQSNDGMDPGHSALTLGEQDAHDREWFARTLEMALIEGGLVDIPQRRVFRSPSRSRSGGSMLERSPTMAMRHYPPRLSRDVGQIQPPSLARQAAESRTTRRTLLEAYYNRMAGEDSIEPSSVPRDSSLQLWAQSTDNDSSGGERNSPGSTLNRFRLAPSARTLAQESAFQRPSSRRAFQRAYTLSHNSITPMQELDGEVVFPTPPTNINDWGEPDHDSLFLDIRARSREGVTEESMPFAPPRHVPYEATSVSELDSSAAQELESSEPPRVRIPRARGSQSPNQTNSRDLLSYDAVVDMLAQSEEHSFPGGNIMRSGDEPLVNAMWDSQFGCDDDYDELQDMTWTTRRVQESMDRYHTPPPQPLEVMSQSTLPRILNEQ